MRQPKRLNSRYPGTCNDCDAAIAPGDPVLWLRKGVVVCADCDASGYDDSGQAIANQAPANQAPATGNNWASALAWNDTAPQPGASIGTAVTQPNQAPAIQAPAIRSQLFRDTRTGEIVSRVPVVDIAHFEKYAGDRQAGEFDAPPGDDQAKGDDQAAPVELAAARIIRTVNADRPQLSNQAATVTDILVTLVNAIDRLTVDDCEAIAAHCLHFANETVSGSRRRAWQQFARTIH